MDYNWVKAFHVISVIAWYAGLFYIFRLYVYHVQNQNKPDVCETLIVMERKLLKIIMLPAKILTLISGIMLISMSPEFMKQGWMHAKLLGVLFLFGYHGLAIATQKKFARRDFFLSERACRFINEVPTVCLFLIVIMVIVKPWI